LRFAADLGFLAEGPVRELLSESNEAGRIINGLISSFSRKQADKSGGTPWHR
jgi:hypothetical protein